jgi:hypothetical protein
MTRHLLTDAEALSMARVLDAVDRRRRAAARQAAENATEAKPPELEDREERGVDD